MVVVFSIIAAAVVCAMCLLSFVVGAKYGLPPKTRCTVTAEPCADTEERMTDDEIKKFKEWDAGFRNIMGYDGGRKE